MPEAAEVEIVRRGLEPLVGATVAEASVFDPRLELDPANVHGRVTATRRRGKLLGLDLDYDRTLAIHLRMTGALLLAPSENARLELRFDDGQILVLVDPRRFATATAIPSERFGSGLGPDLIDNPDPSVLIERAARSRRAAKGVFLDQKLLAGGGNYVADESFWLAGIAPAREACTLDADEWVRLVAAAHGTALRALATGGASFSDYRHVDGTPGGMQETFACYGRAGYPCNSCGAVLAKATVAGRGTTFCSSCQS